MKKAVRILLVSLAAVVLLTACSKSPVDKVSEARSAIDAVVAAGADQFAPAQLKSLSKQYEEAVAELKYQDSQYFKNYTMAEYTLNQVLDGCDLLKAKMAESRGEPAVAVVLRNKPVIFN
jgi:hypothetical protein